MLFRSYCSAKARLKPWTTAVFLLVIALTGILILFISLLLGASLGHLATGDGQFSLSFSYEAWAGKQRKEILSEGFVRNLHKQMFGDTWRWAGQFRKSDKNIGVDWLKISVELRKLLGDVAAQIEHTSYPPDEVAARFHHRHPLSVGQPHGLF